MKRSCLNYTPHFIWANGDVHFCCRDMKRPYLGNIYYNTMDELLNSERARDMRNRLSNREWVCDCLCDIKGMNCGDNIERFESGVRALSIVVDTACNQKCSFCFSDPNIYGLTPHAVNKIVEYLPNVDFLQVSGGETLLSNSTYYVCLKFSEYYKNKLALTTNGKLLNQSSWYKLLERRANNPNHDTEINVSLNASCKSKYDSFVEGGDYDRVVDNIKMISCLRSDTFKIVCSMVIFDDNSLMDMQSFVDKCVDLSVDEVRIHLDEKYAKDPKYNKLHTVKSEYMKLEFPDSLRVTKSF